MADQVRGLVAGHPGGGDIPRPSGAFPAHYRDGVVDGVRVQWLPALPDLLTRVRKAGGRFMVCPVCFNAKQLDKGDLLANAELSGTLELWEWIGDEVAIASATDPTRQRDALPDQGDPG